MQRLTKLQIIEQTVLFYLLNPRSTDGGSCLYLNNDGNKCAFSRCCTDKGVETLHKIFEGKSLSRVGGNVDRFLSDDYKGHDRTFWADVQMLHDYPSHFIPEGGYSPKGIGVIKELMEKYK